MRLLTLALLPFLAYAQVDTGAISGSVTDASGAVIPSAKVVITNVETNIAVNLITNATGFYAAPALKPGSYKIAVTMDGFRGAVRTGIQLRVQERLELDFNLEVGTAASEVTVTASAPLLESETSSLGQVVERRTITDLPLNGRNFIQLATLTAGTLPSTRTAERDNFVSNGARAIQNSYLLDGVDNKNRILGYDKSSAQVVQPVIDAIQEFKVQTSTFSAEFGQAAGGVVNVTLRSGTNQFHGTLFEFLRNSKLDATPYFQPVGGGKPAFIQNQFGATFGGPVIKDRTFFFGSWQSSREINAAPQVATVPLAPMRAGEFGATRMYDPATLRGNVRDLFPNNAIPSSRWDPVAVKLAALYPAANLSGSVRNYFFNPKERVTNDQYNIRADHKLGDHDSIFGRYSGARHNNVLPAPLPPPASDVSIVEPNSQSTAISETHLFGGSKVNEFRFGFVRTQMLQRADAPRRFEEFGIKGTLNDPAITGLPTFPISGFTTLGTTGPGTLPIASAGGTNMPLDKIGRIWQFVDNFSWVRGRHTVKVGGDMQQVTLYGFVTNNARPQFNFNGVYTQNPQSRTGTGSPYGDFLLGLSNNAVAATRSISTQRQRIYQGYIQDDWKATSKLTLNVGLRYELAKPFWELNNNQANFIVDPGPYYAKLLYAGDRKDSGLGPALVHTDYNNFAPRLGLAYQATKRTVVRAGAGFFYGRDETIGVGRRLTNNPPYFIQSRFLSDQLNPLITLRDGFPADALDPARVTNPEVNAYPTEYPLPYVMQWNFNIQQELPGAFVAQASYTGSGSKRMYFVNNINLPPAGAGAIDPRRPIQGVGGVFVTAPMVNGTYQALLGKLERRFTNGLSILASYTYGHSIDGGGQNNDQSDAGALDPRNLRIHKGNSNYDIRQRFVTSVVYELPFGKGKPLANSNRPAGAVLGGWQLSGIFSTQTGQPFTVTSNVDNTNTGATARPNRIRDGNLPSDQRSISSWFDLGAFVTPAGFSYGNSGRNILRGPGMTNIDFSVARTFNLSERFRLQYRGEFFNATNTPTFGLPAFSMGAAGVGVIGSVITPERQIQMALKLQF